MMRKAIAVLNSGVGALALIGGVAALIGLFGALGRIRTEPEDVTSFAVTTGVAALVAAAGLINGRLLRGESSRGRSLRRVAVGLSVLACLLLIAASLIGFSADAGQPTLVVLKYLIIPAVLLAAGAYALLRYSTSLHHNV